MAVDNNELEVDLANEDNTINRTEERIKNLSSKVKETAQERDEAKRLAEEAAAKAEAAEKKAGFLEKFSDIAGKYQGANEYRDKIWEKVNAGYDPEDAAVAVLNSEGKLMPQAVDMAPIAGPAAGGSSSTVIPQADRTAADMTQAERRAALQEANDSGELSQIIRDWGKR